MPTPTTPAMDAARLRARGFALLLLTACLLAIAPRAGAVTIDPGTTSPNLEASGCTSASGWGNGNCFAGCDSECDLADDEARAYLDITNVTIGKKFVETTAYTDFTVSSGGRSGAGVDATLAYDIEWKGLWTLAGAFTGWNDGKTAITLTLSDRTAGNLVRSVAIHNMDADGFLEVDLIEVGAGRDDGSTENTFSTRLIRGHTYRVALKIRLEARGANNATLTLDYFAGSNGVRWSDLTVSVAPDLAEEVERLKERVTVIEERLDSLETRLGALELHTHTYRTGRGEGHNNVEARTSEPIVEDGGEPSDEELERLPALDGLRTPQRLPMTLIRGGSNPLAAPAAVRFSLPEPQSTTLELFSIEGRLVRTLPPEFRAAGSHEVAMDVAGLAPGVYFYRLTAGPYAETRKLILLR